MTEINEPLLRKAVEWVEEQERLPKEARQWQQDSWITPEEFRVKMQKHPHGCGTAYCMAGYIAQLVDERFAKDDTAFIDGRLVNASEAANVALGLGDNSHGMWYGGNSATRIREIAEGLVGHSL